MTRRRWLALALTLVVAASTGACTKKKTSAQPSPSVTASGVVTPRPSNYTSPPPSLPAISVTLSTAEPPWPAPAAEPKGDPQGIYPTAAGLPYGEEQLKVHYHAHLDVIVDGKPVQVPAGIGYVGTPPDHFSALAPLHTHDTSGIVHIENDRPATFVLGQVFVEWGVRFNLQCIGGLCAGDGKELAVYVDGKPVTGDPRRIVLASHQEIAVEYGDSGKLPRPPSSYDFPSGN